ncbi:MAG: DoxX family membrane protein [Bacteroidia bacterium]
MNPKVTMVIRILLGVMMVVFGLNKFIGFMPQPEMSGTAAELMGIYTASGFMFLVGGLEALGGLALLVNKYVPLALTILVAILFNAVVYHLLHDPATVVGALVFLVLAVVLVFANKERFAGILSA